MINISNECNMELMSRYEDNHFDLAIVDPPYGIDYSGKDGLISNGKVKRQNGTYGTIKRKKHTDKKWDKDTPNEEYFNELFRVSKNQIIWGANYFVLPPTKGIICWDKKQMLETFSRWEYAWTSFNKVAKMFCFDNRGFLSGEENIHPTQKPTKLYEWLLMNYAMEGDKILDTHLGSGSISIACHNLKYDLTGCELDTEYYNNAMLRLKNHQAQLTMF